MNVVGVGIVLILYVAGAFCCVLALWARGMGESHAAISSAYCGLPGRWGGVSGRDPAIVERPCRRSGKSVPGRCSDWRATHAASTALVNAAVVCSTSALVGTVAMGMVLTLR